MSLAVSNVRPTASANAAASSARPDDAAYALLQTCRDALARGQQPAAGPVRAWLDSVERGQRSGRKLTVFEHSVLTFFLKQDVFRHVDAELATPAIADERRTNALLRSRMTDALATSWTQLTSKARSDDALLTRLPISVLKHATRHDRVWHAAAFIPVDMTQERVAQREASSLVRDWIPSKAQIAVGLGALAVGAASAIGAQVLVGLVAMHAATSNHEFGVHRVMHPWKALRRWINNGPREDASELEKKAHASTFKKGPNSIADTLAEHDVHHFWTYKRFTEMFSAAMPQEKVDSLIDRRYTPKHAAKIKGDKYASALTLKDIVKLSRTVLPQSLAGAAVALAAGMPWALVGVAAYLVAYPVATGLVHGHAIHLKREERDNAQWWVRALKDTSLMHWATRSHFIHHQSVNNTNFNVCFPGADAWFGTYAQPHFLDLLQMDDEKVVYA